MHADPPADAADPFGLPPASSRSAVALASAAAVLSAWAAPAVAGVHGPDVVRTGPVRVFVESDDAPLDLFGPAASKFAAEGTAAEQASPDRVRTPAIRERVRPPVRTARVDAGDDARRALAEGVRLERSRRWAEAIRHYTDATDAHPDDKALSYGLRRSKVHFAVERRYADRSFDRRLLARDEGAALDLYTDVIGQVRRQYVEPIGSTSLVAHGTESLYLALANDKFLARNLPGVHPDRVRAFRRTLRDDYWNRPVARGTERDTVARVADLGRRTCGLPPTACVMEYLCGACNALDDYSDFMTPDRLGDLYGNIDGEFVGVGIEIESVDGRGQLLRRVLPGGPAEEGGAKAGEYIVAVDGVDCREISTDEAAKLLRGTEGSTLTLKLQCPDGLREVRTARRTVEVKSVEVAELIDPAAGVGYIRMTGFQSTTPREMDEALTDLRRRGMTKLIWDLRGNPGGLLTAAVEVLDRFIPEGTLVSTRGPAFGQTQSYRARRSGTLTDLELVLLIDGDSASASEIVAGAVRDHRRGTIVGRTSYGKWSVQSIIDLERTGGPGLRLTTAKFYSPSDRNYAGVGMEPDVAVPEYEPAPRFAAPDASPSDAFEETFGEDPFAGDAFAGDAFAAADPRRVTGYRGRVADAEENAVPEPPALPQTSLPLADQPDVRAALRVLRAG